MACKTQANGTTGGGCHGFAFAAIQQVMDHRDISMTASGHQISDASGLFV
jgi:hypothetical protein